MIHTVQVSSWSVLKQRSKLHGNMIVWSHDKQHLLQTLCYLMHACMLRCIKAWLPEVPQNCSWILSVILLVIFTNCLRFWLHIFKGDSLGIASFVGVTTPTCDVITVNKFPGKFAHSYNKLSLRRCLPRSQTGSVSLLNYLWLVLLYKQVQSWSSCAGNTNMRYANWSFTTSSSSLDSSAMRQYDADGELLESGLNLLHSSALQHALYQSTGDALSQAVGVPSKLPHPTGHSPFPAASRGSEQLCPVQRSLSHFFSLMKRGSAFLMESEYLTGVAGSLWLPGTHSYLCLFFMGWWCHHGWQVGMQNMYCLHTAFLTQFACTLSFPRP